MSATETTKPSLTWRERTLIAVLMLVARMLADEEWVHSEVKTLATHINVHGGHG